MRSSHPSLNRRNLLKSAAGTGLLAALSNSLAFAQHSDISGSDQAKLPPIRQITRGPKHHWFGYYDKHEFDATGQYVLGMEVDFEHRQPKPEDEIRVGMVDLDDGDRWIDLGASRAWCWQQGCMLQWRPCSKSEIVWNDREGDRFVCRVLDVFSGRRRTIPHPIYTLSPDGRWGYSPDFARLNDCRPGYGYAGLPDVNRDVLAPADSGIFRVNLETGESKLIVSLAEAARVPYPQDIANAKHWFNHLLVNPGGARLEYLHRWLQPGNKWFTTRMFTAAADGSAPRVIDPSGATSHFIWRDSRHILAWTKQPSHGAGFYLFEDAEGGAVEIVGKGVMTVNGHCLYLPGGKWILNDTYPQGKERLQSPYLYNVSDGRRVWLGHFHSPREYEGSWRCDTHPRHSPDGRRVVIDSAHTGQGRQLFLIDIEGIVG
ncbi:MAG: hypothetical protein JW959_10875 [Pirellulales bacterium]|nr:hypothetical protein [Pirellulales bacterium]